MIVGDFLIPCSEVSWLPLPDRWWGRPLATGEWACSVGHGVGVSGAGPSPWLDVMGLDSGATEDVLPDGSLDCGLACALGELGRPGAPRACDPWNGIGEDGALGLDNFGTEGDWDATPMFGSPTWMLPSSVCGSAADSSRYSSSLPSILFLRFSLRLSGASRLRGWSWGRGRGRSRGDGNGDGAVEVLERVERGVERGESDFCDMVGLAGTGFMPFFRPPERGVAGDDEETAALVRREEDLEGRGVLFDADLGVDLTDLGAALALFLGVVP